MTAEIGGKRGTHVEPARFKTASSRRPVVVDEDLRDVAFTR